MKHIIYIVIGVMALSGCGLLGNKSDNKYGTWEKVSSDSGEWIGLSGKKNKVISSVKRKVFAGDSLHAVEFDTLLLNNPDERFELALDANVRFAGTDYDDNAFYVVFSDHATNDVNWTEYKFVSDSLAFTHVPFSKGRQDDYIVSYLSLVLNCGHEQDKEEYLSITYGNVDSTNVTSVKLRVDGLYALASDLVPCYNLD